MSNRIYLGIDPGKNGGIAIIDNEVRYQKMPSTELDIWSAIAGLAVAKGWRRRVHAVIEKVHSMPGEGHRGAFTFGTGYGGLRMALTGVGVPFSEVTPRTWQKELGIVAKKKTENRGQFKNRMRAKCQRLFPDLDLWTESKTYQLCVCDAILIAEYARRTF